MGIDIWAVDYVLLDQNDRILGKTYGYRDDRTSGMDAKVYEEISLKDLYARTGIQKQLFNTIYQLMAVKQKEPEIFKEAKSMLLIPDYFHFLLTGKKRTEYTNATTTQLVSPVSKDWDFELIDRLGYPGFPQLKILLGKKERSVDFADEAIVDFYFLLTASVLALDSFVDGYFFN